MKKTLQFAAIIYVVGMVVNYFNMMALLRNPASFDRFLESVAVEDRVLLRAFPIQALILSVLLWPFALIRLVLDQIGLIEIVWVDGDDADRGEFE